MHGKRDAIVFAGALVLAACHGAGPARVPHAVEPAPPARAVVFHALGFPTVDAPPIDPAELDGLPGEHARSVAALDATLRARAVSTLVLPYGSAFPVEAWPAIRDFVKGGGGLVVLGGAPFRVPVRAEGASFVAGGPSAVFAHELLLGPAEALATPRNAKVVIVAGNAPAVPLPSTTWALTLRFATKKSFPDEHGSDGAPEAFASPLLHVLDERGIPRGCPLLEIERTRGERFVLATSDAKLAPETIRALVSRALDRTPRVRLTPLRASVAPGVAPEVRIAGVSRAVRVRVADGEGHEEWSGEVARDGTVTLPNDLAPGLHRVVAGEVRTAFWVRDEALLRAGPSLGVGADFLVKDGKTFPIVGTTYMASDAQRQFLFDPNPDAWDRDFAAMKRHGITFVRTGIWTAWSRVIPDGKNVDPAVLDALEAYVLTAARHGIVVCFDLFAFLPPAFGGSHAYLDPRALAGQRAMLEGFGRRFRDVSWIHWDLINEPSYAPPDKVWKTRPVRDEHERNAWRTWVGKKHGADLAKLRVLWNVPEDDVLAVPRDEDLSQAFVQVDKRPRKARDFVLFTQEVVAAWARQMRETLRAAAGPTTLVTLGQDEGGVFARPTQQLMADALDYTAVHTWWNNDDLLWDGVLTKVAGKPSLHQETGLMRLEDGDGHPWRTPESAAHLLERKLAYAFMARGAGVVQWAWNVNPTMPIDEESTIGIFRPDGTAKPELDALAEVATFFAEAAPHLPAAFEPDPVVLVIPHARAFLGRTGAIDATKIVVRALAEVHGVVPTAVSDLRLGPADLAGAKLVIVPAPDVLDEAAAHAIFEARGAGAKVLITGAVDTDSYGRRAPWLAALGLSEPSRPVALHERTGWSTRGSVSFEGLLQESLRRASRASTGKLEGTLWHEPLPLELAREREPIAALLGAALGAAGVASKGAPRAADWGVAARVLLAPDAALVVVVNEHADPTTRAVVVDDTRWDVPVRALGARLLLVDRKKGAVIVATPGEKVLRR